MKLFPAILSLALLLSVCGCGTMEPTPIPDLYTGLSDFQNKHGVPIHTFTFNAETGGTFTTPKGTVVIIPPNAFYVMGGLATGPVKFEVRDIYSKSDMILSNVTTQSDGKPIVSGGEAWFRYTQNGDPLYLNPSNPIVIKMVRDPNASSMQLYSGITTSSGNVNWVTSDTATTVVQTAPPIDSSWYWQYELYNNIPTILGEQWENCDHPLANYTPTNFNALVGPEFPMAFTYLSLHDYNTVVDINENFGYEFAPLGYDCTVICVAVKDGKLYTAQQNATITANKVVSLSLQETDINDFKAQLEALN